MPTPQYATQLALFAEKFCHKCKQTKPIWEFYIDRRTKDGRTCYCKPCCAQVKLAWVNKVRNDPNFRTKRRRIESRYSKKASTKKLRSLWQKDDYQRNHESIDAKNRRWRENNHTRYRELNNRGGHVYRAIKRKAAGVYTLEQAHARLSFFGFRCWMCGGPYEVIDHVKPLSKGGSNWPANLRPACRSCNAKKANKWPFKAKILL